MSCRRCWKPNCRLARCAISGHSMGGHGRADPGHAPSGPLCVGVGLRPHRQSWLTPVGQQAFAAYLGTGKPREAWLAHDASQLMATVASSAPTVDQGGGDSFAGTAATRGAVRRSHLGRMAGRWITPCTRTTTTVIGRLHRQPDCQRICAFMPGIWRA